MFHLSGGHHRAKIKDGGEKYHQVQLGESNLVTDRGAVRLGTHPLVPIATLAWSRTIAFLRKNLGS